MKLFTSDLIRNLGIGFLIGALLVGASMVPNLQTEFVSPAVAATADAPTSNTE